VQGFSNAGDEAIDALWRSASEKHQGTKSRSVVHRRCGGMAVGCARESDDHKKLMVSGIDFRSRIGRPDSGSKRRDWPVALLSAMQRNVCNWVQSGLEIDGLVRSLMTRKRHGRPR